MKQPKNFAVVQYVSKGYIPFYQKFLLSYFKHNTTPENVEFVLIAENFNVDDLYIIKQMFDLNKTDLVVYDINQLNKDINTKTNHYYETNQFRDFRYLQQTYKKLNFIEFAGNYNKILLCDTDIDVIKPWDFNYIFNTSTKKIFGVKELELENLYINTGFVVLDIDQINLKMLKNDILRLVESQFHFLPDQDILNFIFAKSLDNTMNKDYNTCAKYQTESMINCHWYGFPQNKEY